MSQVLEARKILAQRVLFLKRAKDDPRILVPLMKGTDQRDGSTFSFEHMASLLEPGEVVVEGDLIRSQDSWRWQRKVLDMAFDEPRIILGKGRQIGVTWILLAADVAECLTMPNTVSLLYRQREDEAVDNLKRWWSLFHSLPKWVREGFGVEVIRPKGVLLPSRDGIALSFFGKDVSEIIPMTSASASGHGRTVRRILLDEAAHIELLADIRAATEPAAGRAHISIVSTAAGRSNPETGEGNEFHRVWVLPGGYKKLFLAYDVHPDRDEEWYSTAVEVQSLKVSQRQEQFPRNEHEAFRLSAGVYFDEDVLIKYRERIAHPVERFDWELLTKTRVRRRSSDLGSISVFVPPVANRKYAVGADVASGEGQDFSASSVIDLSSMEIVAEYHSKVDLDLYARDLHFLGRWYNTALIAVETQGGWGETVIASLRDGKDGRRAYPNLYRHVMSSRADLAESKTFGFPTNTKTRPLILTQLDKALREDTLPWVSNDLLHEMENFILRPTERSRNKKGPWPRAADGFHDDRIFATCIALEMYRLRGEHAELRKRRKRPKRTSYPWQGRRLTHGNP